MNTNKTHYIAMAGLHGCLPQACEVFDSYINAVGYLADLHELSERKEEILRKQGYLELDLHKHGNEYCEIEECDCNNPAVHSDSGEWSE